MTNSFPNDGAPKRNRLANALLILIKGVLPIIILGVGAGGVYAMIKTAPQPEKTTHERRARLVTVVEAERGPHRLQVEATGVVQAAREVTLNPQVAGELIEMSPNLEPGGFFEKGDLIVRIDATDYELAAQMREAELTQMEARRVLERANREVAEREYEVLGEALDDQEKALVLREPQLEAAKADVAAARAMLEDARLDVNRTTVRAPFDAQVVEKYVDLGTRLTAQTPIVRIVGTDTYWVELKLHQADLRWLSFPQGDTPGSTVAIRQPKIWGPDGMRQGKVIRLLPSLTAEGSMARVLVAVDDPLCLKPENSDKPKLLVGQFISAEIDGVTLEDVVVVERSLLRNGDWVWIMDADNRLAVRAIDVAYRGMDTVLVEAGIEDGERIVSTDIATVADGMALRLGDAIPNATAEAAPETAEGTDS